MCKQICNRQVEYRDPIDLIDHPSNMRLGSVDVKRKPIINDL